MSTIAWSPARPQSTGEVLDTTFRIFQATLLKCLPYGLAAMLAAQAPNIHDLARGIAPRGFGSNDASWLTLSAAGTLATLVCFCAIMLRQNAMLHGAPVSTRSELIRTVRRLPGIAALFVLSVLVLVIALAALVLPGVYLSVPLVLAWPAFVIEGQGAVEALRTAWRLTRHQWWHATAVLTVGFTVVMVFVLGVTICAVALPFAGGADVAVATALTAAVLVVMGAIAVPFFGALLIATCGELRVRREGLDLERRLAHRPRG
jgi:membrane-anchored glycerophosphoryl diester phosphodiesterase (GDPDase)